MCTPIRRGTLALLHVHAKYAYGHEQLWNGRTDNALRDKDRWMTGLAVVSRIARDRAAQA